VNKDHSIERAKKSITKPIKVSRNQNNIKQIYSNKAVPIKPNSSFQINSNQAGMPKQKIIQKKNLKFSLQKGIY
jgi:hypothetical protein